MVVEVLSISHEEVQQQEQKEEGGEGGIDQSGCAEACNEQRKCTVHLFIVYVAYVMHDA